MTSSVAHLRVSVPCQVPSSEELGKAASHRSDLSTAGSLASTSPDDGRAAWYRYGIFVSSLTLVTLALGFGLSHLLRRQLFGCMDPGCFEVATTLGNSLQDARGDPCEDFYGFVCGGWQRSNPAAANHFQALQQRVALAAIVSLMLEDAEGPKLTDRVARLFQRCAQLAFNEQHRLGELREFLARFNLSWPKSQPRSKLDILDTLVALSLDWGVPVFFHLSVDVYFKRRGFRILHFGSNPYLLEWFVARNALQEKGTLLRYFNRASIILNGSVACPETVEKVLLLDNRVLPAVVPSLMDPRPDFDMEYVVFRQLDFITGPYLSAAEWLQIVNQHLPINLGLDDEMFVMNRRLLQLLAWLVAGFDDPTALLSYVTWHVARHLAPMTSYPLSHAQFADTPSESGSRSAYTATLGYMLGRCYVDADSTMPFAFAHVFTRRWLPPQTVQNVSAMLSRIRAMANVTMAAVSWMDEDTKRAAFEKLATLRSIVGSPEGMSSDSALRSLYPYVPDLSGSYLEMILALHVAELRYAKSFLRSANGSEASSGERVNVPLTLVNAFYLPVYHVVVIPAAILYPPFYINSHPASYNYGSLGHVLGHELTHAFDPDMGLYGRDGLRHDWWTPASRSMFEAKLACLRRLYNEIPWSGGVNFGDHALSENFADSGGVLKAYRAFKAAPKVVVENQQGEGEAAASRALSRFSAEQLFFVSSCFKWCSRDEKQSPGWYSPPRMRCNVPLLNMPEFAEAFECGAGKAMNPATRCDFM
ncbi:endothelin-converting enzyme 2-like [Dermacentor variabilis]|uniref:endothelin-converting enzyme 2-like n=1 Tax=Dermacentor variabilis TaxID=34621 RepID=UPI003F5B10E6